jgi:hypothetical protein
MARPFIHRSRNLNSCSLKPPKSTGFRLDRMLDPYALSGAAKLGTRDRPGCTPVAVPPAGGMRR